MDLNSINSEILSARSGLNASWADFVIYCKAKVMEAQAVGSGNVASYSIGGRSVTRDLGHWKEMLRFAQAQVNNENGGVQMQDIKFVPRGSC